MVWDFPYLLWIYSSIYYAEVYESYPYGVLKIISFSHTYFYLILLYDMSTEKNTYDMKHELSEHTIKVLQESGEICPCTFNEYEGYYFDGRERPDELPEEWRVYAIRESDDRERHATIEESVIVNFGGWFITYGYIKMNHFLEIRQSTMNGVPYQEFPQIYKVIYDNGTDIVSDTELDIIKSALNGNRYKERNDMANGIHAYKLEMSYMDAESLADQLNEYLEENCKESQSNWFVGDKYENYVDID